jgi:CDP-diacylglycerol---glycerol-3-phosphate 3-phosphatidyltransferase
VSATPWYAGRIVARGDSPASVANIANIITAVRILLAPLFLVLLLLDGGTDGVLRWVAAALFVFTILTDSLDGYLARGRNLVTDVGKLLDPIADKALTGLALVGLSILGELWWWVTVIILVREIAVTVFRFVVVSTVVIPASRGGKIKTWAQAVALSLFLFPIGHVVPAIDTAYSWLGYVVMAIAFVLTVVTGADYFIQAYRRNRPTK